MCETTAHPDDAASAPARSLTRRRVIAGAAAGLVAAAGGGTVLGRGFARLTDDADTEVGRTAQRLARPARRRWHVESIGSSVEGRSIQLHRNVTDAPRATVLAISAIHGDERGAGAIGTDLTSVLVPEGVSAFVVPIANPDGWVRGTRNNARDVDLNRNFPWWFQVADGGPSAASEPETRALMALVDRLRPSLTIWIHQPLEYVAAIDPAALPYAEAWARAAGLPVRTWLSQHGGGESWTYYDRGLPSILVEGTTRQSSPGETYAHRAGFEAVLAAL